MEGSRRPITAQDAAGKPHAAANQKGARASLFPPRSFALPLAAQECLSTLATLVALCCRGLVLGFFFRLVKSDEAALLCEAFLFFTVGLKSDFGPFPPKLQVLKAKQIPKH